MWEGAKGTVMLYKLWTFSVFSLGSRNGFRDSQEPISGMYMRTFRHDIDQVGIYMGILVTEMPSAFLGVNSFIGTGISSFDDWEVLKSGRAVIFLCAHLATIRGGCSMLDSSSFHGHHRNIVLQLDYQVISHPIDLRGSRCRHMPASICMERKMESPRLHYCGYSSSPDCKVGYIRIYRMSGWQPDV